MLSEEKLLERQNKFHNKWQEMDDIYRRCEVVPDPLEDECKANCPDYEHRFLWCQEDAHYRAAVDHMENFARVWIDGCIAYENGDWVMSILPLNNPAEARRRVESAFSSEIPPLDFPDL